MAKKNIRAFFNSYEQAENAATKLRTIQDAEVNLLQQRAEIGGETIPVIGNAAVFGGTFNGTGTATAAGAAILASHPIGEGGLSGSYQGGLLHNDVILEAVVDADEYNKAAGFIEESGGRI